MRKIFTLLIIINLSVWSALAQVKVSGTVIDAEDGTPIIGATVVVKGTSVGTVTGSKGDFSITVPAGKEIVTVSFVGYTEWEGAVTKTQTRLDVKLQKSALKIDEVVVTGFADVKKETFTGSSVKIKADDVLIAGVSDVSRMLEGQVAGVSVQNVSSTFGSAPKVRIRGVTSLSGENKPLWVVDGVVLEDVVNISNDQLSSGDPTTLLGSSVAGINASDIASFDILKDAAATALYGARAMNGVVVITTKKGTQGAPRITYNGNFTIRSKPRYSNYDIMNSADQMSVYSELERKGLLNQDIVNASNSGVYGLMYKAITSYDPLTGFGLQNTREARKAFLMQYAKANTDWFDLLFTHNLQQEHSLSISTGTDKSRTYASIGFMNDAGWSVADKVNRYTLNFRNDYDISRKITIGFQAVASLRQQEAPGSYQREVDAVSGEWSRDFDINPFSYALNTSRTIRPYDNNGNLEYITMNYAPFNILNEMQNNKIELNVMDAKIQGEFKYNIVKGLRFDFTGMLRYVKSDQVHKITEHSNVVGAYQADYNATIRSRNRFLWQNQDDLNAEPLAVLEQGGFWNTSNMTMLNWETRASFAYNKIWDNGQHTHEFSALAGTQIKYIERDKETATQAGYQYDMGGIVYNNVNFYRMMSDRQMDLFASTSFQDRFVAFYASADYAFDRKYSISGTVRYDGSNVLGKSSGSRWLPTWNFGAKWNIQNESFMENVDWLNTFSIRASYGLNASMPSTSNSQAIYLNRQVYRPGYTENEIYIDALGNSELTWEKSYQFNAGVDLTLFDNRLNFSLDYFDRQSFDLIALIRTGGIGGQDWKYANYADLDAHGLDITLGGTLIRTKNVTWTANFTFGYSTNKIKNTKNRNRVLDVVRAEGGNVDGYPVNSLFSIPFVRLNPATGVPEFVNEKGETAADVNMQGTDIDFLKFEGSVDPKYTGGFNTSVRYKNFSFNAFFTYQAGNKIRLTPAYSSTYSDLDAMSNEFKNRFMMTGDNLYPAIADWVHKSISMGGGYPYTNYNYSNARVVKGDFIRLKTVSLNYDFNSAWISKSRFFKSASLRLTVKDPWLIYSDKALHGQDPEFFNTGGVAMPTTTQYTLTLNLGF